MTVENRTRKRRLMPRFRLRSLFLGVTIIAGILGYFAHKAHQRREAIATIRMLGGSVIFEHQWSEEDSKEYRERQPPSQSKWWGMLVPEILTVEVHRVDLNNTNATDEDVEVISVLRETKSLHLCGTRITDDSARFIEAMSSLEQLEVRNTAVGDASLPVYARLPRIRVLGLVQTLVTDAGIPVLRNSNSLRWLNLCSTSVSEDGLKGLAGPNNKGGVGSLRVSVTNSRAESLIGSDGLERLIVDD